MSYKVSKVLVTSHSEEYSQYCVVVDTLKWTQFTRPCNAWVKWNVLDKKQRIIGFGTYLTESDCKLLQSLRLGLREVILRDLFVHAKLGLVRLSIGVDKWSQQFSDFALKQFFTRLPLVNLRNEDKDVFPILDHLLLLKPDVELFLSPWSPPSWLKTSGQLCGGQLKRSKEGTYLRYLARYIYFFSKRIKQPAFMTLQYRPLRENVSFPSNYIPLDQQLRILPRLRKELDDLKCRSIDVLGHDDRLCDHVIHGEGVSLVVTDVDTDALGLSDNCTLLVTCEEGGLSWRSIFNCLDNGVTGLCVSRLSQLIMYNAQTGHVTKSKDYNTLYHFSAFLDKNSTLVKSTTSTLQLRSCVMTSVLKTVIVLMNDSGKDLYVNMGDVARVFVPKWSLVTVVIVE